MKKNILFFVLIGLTYTSQASILPSFMSSFLFGHTEAPQANVKWMSFDEAVTAARIAKQKGQKPKKVFIDVYTDWCGWCKKMDRETFEIPYISEYLNNNYYPVKLNAEMKEEVVFDGYIFKYVATGARGVHELAYSLLEGQMSYPTVVFLNEDFKLIQRVPGYLDEDTFYPILNYLAGNYYQNTPWTDYKNSFVNINKSSNSSRPSAPIIHTGNH